MFTYFIHAPADSCAVWLNERLTWHLARLPCRRRCPGCPCCTWGTPRGAGFRRTDLGTCRPFCRTWSRRDVDFCTDYRSAVWKKAIMSINLERQGVELREGQREGSRERGRERDTERQREIETKRERDKERERERERETETETKRQTERERDRDREREFRSPPPHTAKTKAAQHLKSPPQFLTQETTAQRRLVFLCNHAVLVFLVIHQPSKPSSSYSVTHLGKKSETE